MSKCHSLNETNVLTPDVKSTRSCWLCVWHLLSCCCTWQNEEFYICIYSHRHGDTILFHHEGGIEIGDVDAKVIQMFVTTMFWLCVLFVLSQTRFIVQSMAQSGLLAGIIYFILQWIMDRPISDSSTAQRSNVGQFATVWYTLDWSDTASQCWVA